MCADNKDSTSIEKNENDKEVIVESSETVDCPENEDSKTSDNEQTTEEFTITGKGYHRKLFFLHLISVGFIWLLLRFTFMSSVEPELLTIPVWIGSVLLSVSIHMLTFKNFFQTIAETEEIIGLLKAHTADLSYEEPLTDDNYYENFLEMFENGQVTFKDDLNSVRFNLSEKTKKTRLLIKHRVC